MSNNKSTELPFTCSNVEQAFNENVDVFDSFQGSLNTISEDIRGLEKRLQSKNICIDFSDTYESYAYVSSQGLRWAKPEGNDKFRLCYFKNDAIFVGNDYKRVEEVIPLIECPIQLRVEMHSYLARFIKNFGNYLRDNLQTGSIFPEDPSENEDLQEAPEIQ